MATELTARQRARINRKHVLEALHSETASWGGDVAAERVKAYCRKPLEADATEFAYVGSLTLRRFYVDPDKPNGLERQSLWTEIKKRMAITAANPGGWNGTTEVMVLQAIAQEA